MLGLCTFIDRDAWPNAPKSMVKLLMVNVRNATVGVFHAKVQDLAFSAPLGTFIILSNA